MVNEEIEIKMGRVELIQYQGISHEFVNCAFLTLYHPDKRDSSYAHALIAYTDDPFYLPLSEEDKNKPDSTILDNVVERSLALFPNRDPSSLIAKGVVVSDAIEKGMRDRLTSKGITNQIIKKVPYVSRTVILYGENHLVEIQYDEKVPAGALHSF